MQVLKVTEGSRFAEYALNEQTKTLTVEGVVIDLEAETQDCQTLINITRTHDGDCVRGLEGKAGYVADIEIPPREYIIEEIEPPVEDDDEEEAEGGGNTMGRTSTKTPLPLDLKKVVLRLWPYGAEETIQEEG
jgi:hypothetical protein